MASRSYNNYGSFRPVPRSVNLDFPESRSGYNGARRREARPLPRFEDDVSRSRPRFEDDVSRSRPRFEDDVSRPRPRFEDDVSRPRPRFEDDGYGGTVKERARSPAYGLMEYDDNYRTHRPEVRERPAQTYREPRADVQRRRRPNGPNPARRRPAPRRQETPVRKGLLALAGINFAFKFNPLYRQIAIVVTGLVTIIAVAIILIANAVAYNALAVFVDGEHVGYIEYTAGWSSEIFHEDAIRELQGRRGVGVNVEQTVTLEPARASQSEITTRGIMLTQIANDHFSYKLSAVAIYAFDPHIRAFRREALMRSMADVDSTRYLLTQRFQTSNTIYYGFYPDWRLVSVEVDDVDVQFTSPQEAFARLDRRIREYVEYVIQTGDTLIGIARHWDMELAELIRVNNISAGTPIMPGQRILVVTQAPLLSVITIEETSRVETLPRPVEPVYVDTLAPAQTRVRQEGRDGEHTVITRTTRRGTMIINEEEFPGEVIIEAVPMIQEVGRAR